MKIGIWLLPLILLAGAAAAEIRVSAPPDKTSTFERIVRLEGWVSRQADVKVQNVPFSPRTDGAIACGLVLNPGKNLVVIKSGPEGKRLRLLRLVTFPDIEHDEYNRPHWGRGQILYPATLGIVEGYPDGNFYPDNPATRGEFATWLAKAKNLPAPAPAEDVYFDVPKEHWRAPYVKAAAAAGLMPAYTNGKFGIDDPLLRRDAYELAARAEGMNQLPPSEPDRAITRAEAAALVSRFAFVKKSTDVLADFETGYTADKLCGLNVAPAVLSFNVSPSEVPVNKPASLKLRAVVASRGVFAPISQVKVNLMPLGGAPDAEMSAAPDGSYLLNLTFQPKTTGEKKLEVTATDRLGWEGKTTTPVLIVE